MINGEPATSLPATDRGLQYGDGLFETLAVRAGRIELWEKHMARLLEGCERLGIPAPDSDLLRREVETLAAGEDAVVKIIVTRGSGGRGYRAPRQAASTRIVSRHPWPDYPEEFAQQGVKMRSCRTRLAIQPSLAGLKHLNRLEQVLARSEWSDEAIFEGVMRDPRGGVIEGTMSNLFFVQNGRVLTADLSECGVAGVMRCRVMEACAALEIPLQVKTLGESALRPSQEIFITNSLIGLWPVRAWDETEYTVPGPVTRTLRNYLNESEDGT